VSLSSSVFRLSFGPLASEFQGESISFFVFLR
jgi:hypothetical protein